MPDLFFETKAKHRDTLRPLADRIRPNSLHEIVGQEHILHEGSLLRKMITTDTLRSVIFWGPPGTGKTTLANVIANETNWNFIACNASAIGVKEIREIIAEARSRIEHAESRTIVFLDEIHQFHKGQQDVLLEAVEQGILILIGATTENPAYSVNNALMSRSTIFQLEPLNEDDIKSVISRAIQSPKGYQSLNLNISHEVISFWAKVSDGDARRALNALEVAVCSTPDCNITLDIAQQSIQKKMLRYDKHSDGHYDHASALIKSVRLGDTNGALYWLACMLEAGEDPRFIARRMSIFASEDIGLADTKAMEQAAAAWLIVERVGMPECVMTLSQLVIYLSQAPKSRAAYDAIHAALNDVRNQRTVLAPVDHDPQALPNIQATYFDE